MVQLSAEPRCGETTLAVEVSVVLARWVTALHLNGEGLAASVNLRRSKGENNEVRSHAATREMRMRVLGQKRERDAHHALRGTLGTHRGGRVR